MIDDKIPRRINPKGIGLIYIYIYIYIYGSILGVIKMDARRVVLPHLLYHPGFF